MDKPAKPRAPRNRTIELTSKETARFRRRLLPAAGKSISSKYVDSTILGDSFEALKRLPAVSFDLLFADPPYNLNKNFGENSFQQTSSEEYEAWLDSWLQLNAPPLKTTASIYISG